MRREWGHSELCERALLPVLPAENEFPFRWGGVGWGGVGWGEVLGGWVTFCQEGCVHKKTSLVPCP